MKVQLKEGWIRLNMVYGDGREEWLFTTYEPSYYDCEAYNAKKEEFFPANPIRIMYCEADNAEVSKD